MIWGGELIEDGDGDSGKGGDDVYKGSAEPVLISLSNLYSDDEISVSDSVVATTYHKDKWSYKE